MIFLSAGYPISTVYAEDVLPAEELTETEQTAEIPEDTIIETGDAVSGTDVVSEVNTNTTNQEHASEESQEEDTESSEDNTDEGSVIDQSDVTEHNTETDGNTASSTSETVITGQESPTSTTTPDVLPTDEEDTGTTTPSIVPENNQTASSTNADDLTLEDEEEEGVFSSENENNAAVVTNAGGNAGTGSNTAESNAGNAVVSTGTASAYANITNLVNSNFVNSEGYFQLLNLFGNAYGDISLSFDDGATCSFLCFLTNMMVRNTNNAQVTNNVSVSADTGSNTASSTDGSASIATGDAFAASNIVNVVNTNVINSDYLAFIMNAFGSWEGDLVLPPNFFADDEQVCDVCGGGASGSISVSNENDADIGNNATTTADTGSNTASGNTGAHITTGNAYASSNLMTIANTNLFGNNMMLLYVRTGGRWSGQIFSLPSGLRIIGMEDGFIINGMSSGAAASTPSTLGAGGSVDVTNNNTAVVRNNVSVSASTGNNTANGNNASIQTGNAYAASNIVNLVNTNVIGQNWLLAIVNIFGGWNGDLAFGRPDLWLGVSATAPSVLTPTSESSYTLTYRNNGDAYATDVDISSTYADGMRITNAGGGVVDRERRTITYHLDYMNPGASGAFTYTAEADGSAGYGSTAMTNKSCATLHEDDANNSDNCDMLVQTIEHPAPSTNVGYDNMYARLEIAKKRIGEGIVMPGDEVEYEITVSNRGSDYAYNVVVEDEIKNEDGDVISKNGWNLDTVYPDEQGEGAIKINYVVEFASTTPAGTYTNFAIAYWHDENGNFVDHSGHALVTVEVGDAPEPPANTSIVQAGDSDDVNNEEFGVGGSLVVGDNAGEELTEEIEEEQQSQYSALHDATNQEVAVKPSEVHDSFTAGNPTLIQSAVNMEDDLLNEAFMRTTKSDPWWKKNLSAGLPFIVGSEFSFFWILIMILTLGGYLLLDRKKYSR